MNGLQIPNVTGFIKCHVRYPDVDDDTVFLILLCYNTFYDIMNRDKVLGSAYEIKELLPIIKRHRVFIGMFKMFYRSYKGPFNDFCSSFCFDSIFKAKYFFDVIIIFFYSCSSGYYSWQGQTYHVHCENNVYCLTSMLLQ